MKKIHICRWAAAVVAALLVCTAYCGCTRENAADIEKPQDYKAPAADTEATLTVLTSEQEQVAVENARADFAKSYPNVKVEIRFYNENADTIELGKLHAKQMAGEGADVVLMDEDGYARVCDFNKAQRDGAFVDLARYFDRDPNWSWDSYAKEVVYGMRQGDKQYLLPLYYNLSVLVTTDTLLKQSGIKLSRCQTGIGLLDELTRCEQQAKDSGYHMIDSGAWQNFSELFAVNPVTFRSGRAKVSWTEEFDETLRAYDHAGQALGWFENTASQTGKTCYQRLVDGKTYFVLSEDSRQTFTDLASIALKGEYPQMLPIYTADGSGITARASEVAAISSSCENPKLAYEFIKCLLTYNAQYMYRYPDIYGSGYRIAETMPINSGAMSCVIIKNGFHDETVRDADGRELVIDSWDYLELYMQMTNEVVYTYIDSKCDVDAEDCFEPYFKREQRLDACYENADDRLSIYLTE